MATQTWTNTRIYQPRTPQQKHETEPPLDQHMLVFTSKCFPSPGKRYSRRYQVPAETERFVWLARDHTLYPGFWSKWKLSLNKITSGDVQQAKQRMQKLSLPLATKLNLISLLRVSGQYTINCFSHISTEERTRHYSETSSNISGTYTCWKHW